MKNQVLAKKKVLIRTFGCQMNVRDSEAIAGLLTTNNYKLTTDPDDADVVIFNTCSVRESAENRVWAAVRSSKIKNQKSKIENKHRKIIGLVGCMASNYREAIFEKAPDVDFVVGTADIDKIPEIIDKFKIQNPKSRNKKNLNLHEFKVWETEGKIRPEEIYHSGFHADAEHAFVVISEGCENFCSYCVVPYVRGKLRSRAPEDILREVKDDIQAGITRITLLGQNVSAYESGVRSSESGVGFIDLLKKVNDIEGLKEFTFLTSHPKDTSVGLFKAIRDCSKLKKDLHLPVQSGSERILKLMNRGYTVKYYLDLVNKYRKIVKGGTLTSDIIVGFPGETEKDFRDSVNLIKKARFNSAFIFKYSPRPHTAAAKFADTVPKEEKERRHSIILELQRKISNEGKRQK